MDTTTPYITHPSNAQEASRFHQQQQAPSSLSFPAPGGHLTPPSSEKDASQKGSFVNGQTSQQNGAVPNTPAATPGVGTVAGSSNVSGIIPTLQYVHLGCGSSSLLTSSQKHCRYGQLGLSLGSEDDRAARA